MPVPDHRPVATEAQLDALIKAYDVRGVVPDQLDEDVARAAGAAFAELTGAARIVTAHDMRDSSVPLSRAFAEGATSRGVDVVEAGLGSTDMLYFGAGSLDLPGAMFTASHNPARYNGIKMCRAGAAPIGQDSGLADIRRMIAEGLPAYDGTPGTVSAARPVRPNTPRTCNGLVDLTGHPAAQGRHRCRQRHGRLHRARRARRPAARYRRRCTSSSTAASPTTRRTRWNRRTFVDLQAKVREVGADLGLAFDGDADRCFVVDENGAAVPPSAVTALVATRELAKDPGSTHHLQPDHLARGPRDRGGARRHPGPYAGRALVHQGRDGPYRRDLRWRAFGPLLLPRLLAGRHRHARRDARPGRAGRSGPAACRSSPPTSPGTPPAARSTRPSTTRPPASPRCGSISPAAEIDELDGLTVDLGDGRWFNLRASNTEPLLRLNVEAAGPGRRRVRSPARSWASYARLTEPDPNPDRKARVNLDPTLAGDPRLPAVPQRGSTVDDAASTLNCAQRRRHVRAAVTRSVTTSR